MYPKSTVIPVQFTLCWYVRITAQHLGKKNDLTRKNLYEYIYNLLFTNRGKYVHVITLLLENNFRINN